MLQALQPCLLATAAGGGFWARLAPIAAAVAKHGSTPSIKQTSSRGLASTRAVAAAASPAAWPRCFEGVAPGSVLRIDLPDSAADVSVRVGEHEAIEVSGSEAWLEAEHVPHDGHPGSSLGEDSDEFFRWPHGLHTTPAPCA